MCYGRTGTALSRQAAAVPVAVPMATARMVAQAVDAHCGETDAAQQETE